MDRAFVFVKAKKISSHAGGIRLDFVNECRVADITGVAVAFGRSEPLMRVFKRTNEPASPEDMAVGARLQAITDRGKIEVEQYSAREEAIEVQGPRRLFQMPDEIVAESGVA